MVKIRDIAEKSGYSISTVSKALNGRGRISEKVREEILNLAKEMGYTPNFHARNMASKSKIMTIGLIVPDIKNPFFSALTRGVERYLDSSYLLILMDSFRNLQRENRLIAAARFYGVKGLIIGNSRVDSDLVKEVCRYLPVVIFDKETECENVSSIVLDNFYGAYTATKHLIDGGYKRIVHLGGTSELYVSLERKRGYESAMKEAGLEPIALEVGYTFDDGYNGVLRLLESKIEFDGLFCMNDLVALGAMRALKELGYKIPDDVGIVGFDDDEQLCEIVSPSLTSVRQPVEMMGETAGKLIVELIKKNSSTRKVVFSPMLVIRESSVRRK